MKCNNCGRKAIAEITYLKKFFCDRCFSKMYERKVRRVIAENKMIDKEDKILCAVSGGKDSLVLLYILHNKHLDITALTIDEGIKGYRDKSIPYVKKFCKQNKIPLIIKSFKKEYGFTLDELFKKAKKPMCSYCGVLRRDIMNKTAKEIKADKLATGHNLDDEAQTVLMNFLRGELKRLGRTSHKAFVKKIKPLRECLEKENIIYALLHNIEYEDFECPYSRAAYRDTVRDLLNAMETKYPGTKINVLKNYDQLLPFISTAFKETPKKCKSCGGVTTQDFCAVCKLKKEFR